MSRKRRRGHREEAEKAKEIDRISHLSDDILHHILSLLDDTRTAVKTSLLSKRWRCLWKDVRALSLDQNPFSSRERYATFVRNLLSFRSDHATIDKLSFTSNRFDLHDHHGSDHESFDMVMDYAGRTGRDHDRMLRALSISYSYVSGYREMVESIVRHNHHESLEALELTGFIDFSVVSGRFRMLKDLRLVRCSDVDLGDVSRCFGTTLTTLVLSQDELIFPDDHDDPFLSFPRLECLKILHCRTKYCSSSSPSSFKVSGLRLLEMEFRCWAGNWSFPLLSEVLAPRLESFCFGAHMSRVKFRELSLPSLVRASVELVYYTTYVLGWADEVAKLLRGLRSAKSLDLCILGQSVHPRHSRFNDMKQSVMDEVYRFTRLKTSSIRYSQHESPRGSTCHKRERHCKSSSTRPRWLYRRKDML